MLDAKESGMSMPRARSLVIGMAMVLSAAGAAVAVNPGDTCVQDRYKAAAKYHNCEEREFSKFFVGAGGNIDDKLGRCFLKYGDGWTKMQEKASGTGAWCDAPRLVDNGNGTVTDRLTGLQWEKKTSDA